MKKILCVILALFMAMSVFALSVNAEDGADITVVFTHDVHSYIDTANDNTGGFARVKTIIDQTKKEDPDTFVLDGGDFSMGTLYQSIFTTDAAELRLLGYMGYDATTFGNHEFDYGADGLSQMLMTAKNSGDPLPKIVCSNINWESSTGEHTQQLHNAFDEFGASEYTIIEKGGVKAAIFGLMGEDADDCAPNSGLTFESITENAAKVVSNIKEKENPDIIMCLSHSGTTSDLDSSEDVLLARAVPDIDLIISAHSHTKLEKPIIEGNTVIASCGEYAKNVGRIKMNKDSSKWSVESYEIIPMDSSVESDKGTLDKIGEFKKNTEKYLEQFGYEKADEVIAYSPYEMASLDQIYNEVYEHGLGYLITDSYIYAVKKAEGENYEPVDVAIVPSGVIRSTFHPGNVTVSDAFEVLSLGMGMDGVPGYPLVSVYLTGKELKTVAELDASVSEIMNSARLFCSGLHYTFNPNRLLLNRVTDVWLVKDGERVEIDDNKLYRVVADYYSGQMLSTVNGKSYNLLSLVPKDKDGNELSGFESQIISNGKIELKAWYALASYLESFDKQNSLPTIPETYSEPQGRKNIDNSKNIIDIIKNPNKIAFILLGVLIVLILIIVLIIILIVKIVKKIRRKKKAQKEER